MSTWKGIKVKHQDGREGVIASDYAGFMHRALHINVVGAEDAYVQLNSDGPDSGEAGWSWWCENFSDELLHPMRCKGWSFTGRMNPRLGQFLTGY